MKPFLSESCKRTDRDVGKGGKKARVREETAKRGEERREKTEAGHRHLCENNTF